MVQISEKKKLCRHRAKCFQITSSESWLSANLCFDNLVSQPSVASVILEHFISNLSEELRKPCDRLCNLTSELLY